MYPLFLIYTLKAYRIKYFHHCYESEISSKGLIPELKEPLWEEDLNLPSSLRRVNQEERCEECGVVSAFIWFCRPVEVSAVLMCFHCLLVTKQISEVHHRSNCYNCFPPHLGQFSNSSGSALWLHPVRFFHLKTFQDKWVSANSPKGQLGMKLEDAQNSSSYAAHLAGQSMGSFFMLWPYKGGGYCTLWGDVKYLRRKEALYYVLRAFPNHFDSFP